MRCASWSRNHAAFEVLTAPRSAGATAPSSYAEMPFLLRSMEVTYAPSASVLASLTRLRPTDPSWAVDFMGFGDPLPSDATRQAAKRSGISGAKGLGRLLASADEIRSIAELFPPERTRIYTAENALERRLKEDPTVHQARYLHFATHGLVDTTIPSQSALLLSHSDDGEDGLLQAFEIVELNLSADLVTLSAYETGLGRFYRGEGLLGLSRAFVYAGADRLLASLWRVADTSTRELMTIFYRELQQDPSSPAAALRRAKLSLLDRPDRAHPHAWAPFVLFGG